MITLTTISTEDGEDYKYIFEGEPSNDKIKKFFFEEHPDYEEKDWGICITLVLENIAEIKLK